MDEIVMVAAKSTDPVRHQLGKLAFGTFVGFVASKLSEKVYDAALEAYRVKRAASK